MIWIAGTGSDEEQTAWPRGQTIYTISMGLSCGFGMILVTVKQVKIINQGEVLKDNVWGILN